MNDKKPIEFWISISEKFGIDVDRNHAVEPAKSTFGGKSQLRRAIEAAGIPHTYLVSNAFAGYFLPTLVQPGASAPPRDKVVILGDGNAKAVFNEEHDIGTFTIKSVDDPRTLNKIVYIRPPKNAASFNEIVAIREKKIGKTLEKEYVPEEQLLKQIQESPIPVNVILSINHAILVKGDTTNFEIEPSFGVEASELYPEVKYTTVPEEYSLEEDDDLDGKALRKALVFFHGEKRKAEQMLHLTTEKVDEDHHLIAASDANNVRKTGHSTRKR
ncbi:OLC1v1030985C1 [Oldenlandia corymbosa var. corymbosa]|uniref:OLC1v1030985C1 n=1 Tax=Oldenlandia corymbosa var. corymbosa TaxID=529605 RepID=A0AAV1CIF1_OLDCO|nr:OLC1v1030985C1 [Oldenlandia corymbosa var. corymbosa]